MKNLLFTVFLLVVIILVSSPLFSKTLYQISGFITDQSTGKPIPDANILLNPANMGTASRDGGFYSLSGIQSGLYTIEVRVIGYQTVRKSNIEIDNNVVLNFELVPAAVEFAPVLITATLSEHLQSKVTVSSDIITGSRLQILNGNTAGEIIESVCGIYSKSYDSFAGLQTPSIRGANTDQVLVLMDGMRLNTAQGGGVDLNQFPKNTVERIEIIRGGHSALLGSDAVGGAIHLISKSGSHENTFLSFNSTLGSFGTQIYDFHGSQQLGPLSVLFNYNYTESEGNFRFSPPDSEIILTRTNNQYRGNNVFTKMAWQINPKNQIHVLYQNLHTKKGSAGSVLIDEWSGDRLTTPEARSDNQRQYLTLQSNHQISNVFRVKEQLSCQQFDYQYINPAGMPPVDDIHKNQSLSFRAHGQYAANSILNLLSGFEFRQDKLSSTQMGKQNRNSQGFFIQSEIRYQHTIFRLPLQWTIIPAVRWDNYSDIQSRTSPKIGMMIGTGKNVYFAIKSNYGRSFRAPTFNDLYWPEDDWGNRGNPDLTPEFSTDFDAGIQINSPGKIGIMAEVTYFNNHIQNLIQWAPITNDIYSPWMPQNVASVKIKGLETKIQIHLPDNIFVEAAHTLMKATDHTSNTASYGNRLIYRPDHKIDVITGIKLWYMTANLNFRHVSKRMTTSDNMNYLDAYQLLNGNIGLTCPLSKVILNAKLQMINLLDRSIYITDGYPLPGREYRLTFGIQY